MICTSRKSESLMIWTPLAPKLTPFGTSGCNANHINAGAELRAKRPAFWPSAPVPGEGRSRVATAQYRRQSLLDELTRPLDQVADNRGRGHDLVHQPNALARQEIHGLDISRRHRVREEPHEPQHRDRLTRNL